MERWKRGCLISLALCLCISLKLQTAAQARMRMDFRKLPCRTQNADQGILTETEELELYARSAVLMDGDSGRVLYAKNAQESCQWQVRRKL